MEKYSGTNNPPCLTSETLHDEKKSLFCSTVCTKIIGSLYMVSYYIKWVKPSWPNSSLKRKDTPLPKKWPIKQNFREKIEILWPPNHVIYITGDEA